MQKEKIGRMVGFFGFSMSNVFAYLAGQSTFETILVCINCIGIFLLSIMWIAEYGITAKKTEAF